MGSNLIRFPEWIFRQSAALPYRQGPDGLQFLLVTSRNGSHWILPKGIVEPGLTAPESAAKEAREEAGVEGHVKTRRLGSYRYKKWGGNCEVEIFPLAVTVEAEHWPESGLRRREWLSVPDALERIANDKLRKIVRRFSKTIDANTDPQSAAGPRNGPVAAAEPKRLIYILRHGKSSWEDPGLRDFDRPLAPRGTSAIGKIRAYMAVADIDPDIVLCSPAKRTRQTLEQIQPNFGDDTQIRFDHGMYNVGVRGLSNRLRRLPKDCSSVLLIGHNPGLQELALDLVGSGDGGDLERMEIKFPTGALAILVLQERDWDLVGQGACELHSFVVPRQL